jgi:hypothetical protein
MNAKRFYLFILAVFLMSMVSLGAVFAQDATATASGNDQNQNQAGATQTSDGSDDTGEATQDATDSSGTGGNAQGQNQTGTTGTGDTVTCDADLILTWYIAERFFNFGSIASQMSGDTVTAFNTDNIDRGQFASLFDNLNNSAVAGLDATDETLRNMTSVMSMSDTDFEEQMAQMGGANINAARLATGTIAEAQECATLRTTLRRFFVTLAMSDAQMSNTGATNTGTSTGNTTGNSTGNTGNTTGNSTGSSTGNSTGNSGTNNSGTNNSGTNTASNQAGVYTIDLAGANEIPGPGDADLSGTATVYLRTESNEVCVDLSLQRVTSQATGAAIYRATAGQTGAPVISLIAPNAAGLSSTCVAVDPALMQEFINSPQNFYISVQNANFPNGAVRGQMR